jgi:hypothetical protein
MSGLTVGHVSPPGPESHPIACEEEALPVEDGNMSDEDRVTPPGVSPFSWIQSGGSGLAAAAFAEGSCVSASFTQYPVASGPSGMQRASLMPAAGAGGVPPPNYSFHSQLYAEWEEQQRRECVVATSEAGRLPWCASSLRFSACMTGLASPAAAAAKAVGCQRRGIHARTASADACGALSPCEAFSPIGAHGQRPFNAPTLNLPCPSVPCSPGRQQQGPSQPISQVPITGLCFSTGGRGLGRDFAWKQGCIVAAVRSGGMSKQRSLTIRALRSLL